MPIRINSDTLTWDKLAALCNEGRYTIRQLESFLFLRWVYLHRRESLCK